MRATTSGRSSATSRIALRSANSPYASSTTTKPSVAPSSASTVSAGSTVPVGLLGLHSKTSAGRCSATSARAAAGSTVKSAVRSPTTTAVPVMRAMCECRAYVGSKTAAVRPAPPKVSSSVWSTSLEPLAHNRRSTGWPSWSASAARSSRASRSGYRFRGVSRNASNHASTKSWGGAYGLSFVLSRTGTSSCGEW